MQCPVCQVELRLAERQGIEIDYCPKCRGVWLDRGELDKLIERSEAARYGPGGPDRAAEYREHEYREQRGSDYYHRKRKGFLGELFDFD